MLRLRSWFDNATEEVAAAFAVKPALFVLAVAAVAAMSPSLRPTSEQMLPGTQAQSDAHADMQATSLSQGLSPDAEQKQSLAWPPPLGVPAAPATPVPEHVAASATRTALARAAFQPAPKTLGQLAAELEVEMTEDEVSRKLALQPLRTSLQTCGVGLGAGQAWTCDVVVYAVGEAPYIPL
jgi:hypothetical protein